MLRPFQRRLQWIRVMQMLPAACSLPVVVAAPVVLFVRTGSLIGAAILGAGALVGLLIAAAFAVAFPPSLAQTASTVDRVIDQFPTEQQSQIRIMLSESLKGVIAQNLCRKIGGGRAAALEVLLINSAISNLIREAKTFQIPSMMQVGRASGMVSLNDALMDLVTKKLVEPEEAYLKSVDKPAFEALLKRANIDTKFVSNVAQ
jgi:hypothetical protein